MKKKIFKKNMLEWMIFCNMALLAFLRNLKIKKLKNKMNLILKKSLKIYQNFLKIKKLIIFSYNKLIKFRIKFLIKQMILIM